MDGKHTQGAGQPGQRQAGARQCPNSGTAPQSRRRVHTLDVEPLAQNDAAAEEADTSGYLSGEVARAGVTADQAGQGDEQVGPESDEGVGPQSDGVQQMPLSLQADGSPHKGRGRSVQAEGGDVHEGGPS